MSVISIQTKKMGDLQTVTEVAKTDLLIIHDGSGMKTVTMEDLVKMVAYTLQLILE